MTDAAETTPAPSSESGSAPLTADSGSGEDSAAARDRSIRAADAALKAAAPEADPDAPVDPKAEPAPKTEPTTPQEKTKFAVAARARQQAQRITEAAEARAREVAEGERALARRTQQIELEAERRANALLQQRLASARKAPGKFLQEAGLEPQAFVDAFVREGAPDPVAELAEKNAALEARLNDYLTSQERAATQARDSRYEQQFTGMIASDEAKYPALNARYGANPRALASAANNVAQQFHDAKGFYPSWPDIAEYLEENERQAFEAYEKKKQAAHKSEPPSKGQPPQVERGNGPRTTLSTRRTSERATNQVPYRELSPEQQREHLKSVAEKAMRDAQGGGAP